ncbi:hypothetical protein ACVIGB_008943 [Bradyrhizobium sp. USDA 4341]
MVKLIIFPSLHLARWLLFGAISDSLNDEESVGVPATDCPLRAIRLQSAIDCGLIA